MTTDERSHHAARLKTLPSDAASAADVENPCTSFSRFSAVTQAKAVHGKLLSASQIRIGDRPTFGVLYMALLLAAFVPAYKPLSSGNFIAVQQKKKFFELAPWEQAALEARKNGEFLPKNPFAPQEDRGGVVVAQVFIAQHPDALPLKSFSLNAPIQSKRNWALWQCAGRVAAESEDLIPAACQHQRKLIIDWAIAAGKRQSKFSDAPLTRKGDVPITLCWGYGARPGSFQRALQPSFPGELNLVPFEDLPGGSDPPRCGFQGVTTMAYKDANGLTQYGSVELPFN